MIKKMVTQWESCKGRTLLEQRDVDEFYVNLATCDRHELGELQIAIADALTGATDALLGPSYYAAGDDPGNDDGTD